MYRGCNHHPQKGPMYMHVVESTHKVVHQVFVGINDSYEKLREISNRYACDRVSQWGRG